MAEPTLAITRAEIVKQLAHQAGYGYTAWDSLSTGQKNLIAMAIATGLRQFYTPPPMRNDPYPHTWSFLAPEASMNLYATGTVSSVVTVTLTATASVFKTPAHEASSITFTTSGNTYAVSSITSGTVAVLTTSAAGETGTFTIHGHWIHPLPDDFGGLVRAFRADDGLADSSPLTIRNESHVAAMHADNAASGDVLMVATRPAAKTTGSGQRWELLVYPRPSSTAKLLLRYHVLPDALADSSNEYPHGGSMFGEAILQSCRAALELTLDNRRGEHYATFLERLASAIQADRVWRTARNYGYNGDGSDTLAAYRRDMGSVYYNGTIVT